MQQQPAAMQYSSSTPSPRVVVCRCVSAYVMLSLLHIAVVVISSTRIHAPPDLLAQSADSSRWRA